MASALPVFRVYEHYGSWNIYARCCGLVASVATKELAERLLDMLEYWIVECEPAPGECPHCRRPGAKGGAA